MLILVFSIYMPQGIYCNGQFLWRSSYFEELCIPEVRKTSAGQARALKSEKTARERILQTVHLNLAIGCKPSLNSWTGGSKARQLHHSNRGSAILGREHEQSQMTALQRMAKKPGSRWMVYIVGVRVQNIDLDELNENGSTGGRYISLC